jgi:transposase
MRYIQGIDRNQTTLLPVVTDDYIQENNPVRFIDAYIDRLDLKDLGFTYAETKETGRKPYNPADLLKLYIYGYLNKIRSSRQLEKATYRNIELIWLIRRLNPDFKTIADFRRDNVQAIRQVCRDFTLLCKKLKLFGAELVAIDGSKFSASNSNHRSFTKNKLQKLIKDIDNKIDSFLKDMDEADQKEKDINNPSAEELKKKIDQLREHKVKYQSLQSQMEQSGETQISMTDPDSRLMTTSKGKDVAYNVQIVTDEKHKLIVTHEVTNCGSDQTKLHKMASQAKEVLEVNKLTALGDAGYWSRDSIKDCHDDGIETYVPHPTRSRNKRKGLYTKQDFQYDPETDTYRCPEGQILTYRGLRVASGKLEKKYMTEACKICSSKSKCTTSIGKRYINRWIHEEVMEALDERLKKNPDKMRLRKSLVEHPFGTIKYWMGYHDFLTRGIDKVSAEMSLSVLAYNLKRVLNIVNFKELMLAIQ